MKIPYGSKALSPAAFEAVCQPCAAGRRKRTTFLGGRAGMKLACGSYLTQGLHLWEKAHRAARQCHHNSREERMPSPRRPEERAGFPVGQRDTTLLKTGGNVLQTLSPQR